MKRKPFYPARRGLALVLLGLLTLSIPWTQSLAATSINSTSQNAAKKTASVPQQSKVTGGVRGYQILSANDLGMHCSDLDYRVAAILPPYNTLHSQVIQIGTSTTNKPKILDDTTLDLYYSAAANPNDPIFVNGTYTAPPGYQNPSTGTNTVFKGNFWACKPGQASCAMTDMNAYSAYDAFYPPGILNLFGLTGDIGLPTPDVERLYLGDGVLVADQSKMPGQANPLAANAPQKFSRFNNSYPVFKDFSFGYVADPHWFSAEGIPISNWDDAGRLNAYPLMRVQAVPKGLSPTVSSNVLATIDTTTPVSGEANCRSCHTNNDASNGALGGNGTGTASLSGHVYAAADDPQVGKVPLAVSVEYAADKNLLALHDLREGTTLVNQTPVACQSCHYSPALDLAHLGPLAPPDPNANGRQQTTNQSMSRVMHNFHGQLKDDKGNPLIPAMPPPNQRTAAQTQNLLQQTCYTCHPGKNTKCLRGVMASNNVVCQDCHGGMDKVGNDFSRTVSAANPNSFILDGSARVPWADEPGCGSCHTGDALSNLAGDPNVIKSADGINLAQAYRTNDPNAKPIVPGDDPLGTVGSNGNKRFAEPMVATQSLGQKPMLYRFSTEHGGVFCQGCHGSTHAESGIFAANANDNMPSIQLQGHTGPIAECTTCHKNDLGITLKGPHGMHPVGNSRFVNGGHENYAEQHLDECKACHGKDLLGTALSKAQTARTLTVENRKVTLAKGQQVACNTCHEMPGH